MKNLGLTPAHFSIFVQGVFCDNEHNKKKSVAPRGFTEHLADIFTFGGVSHNLSEIHEEFVQQLNEEMASLNGDDSYNIPPYINFYFHDYHVNIKAVTQDTLSVRLRGKGRDDVMEFPLEKAKNSLVAVLLRHRTGLSNKEIFIKEDGGLNISGNIHGQNLSGLHLNNLTIKNASFSNVDMRDVTITNSEIINSEFKDSRINNTRFESVNIDNINMKQLDASRMVIIDGKITNSVIDHANMEWSSVMGTEFTDVKFSRSEFRGLKMKDVTMNAVEIEYSGFSDLQSVRMRMENNCLISKSNFINAKIKVGSIVNSTIESTDLTGSSLHKISVCDSTISKLILDYARWLDSQFNNVIISDSAMIGMDIINTHFSRGAINNCSLSGTTFHDSSLFHVAVEKHAFNFCDEKPIIRS